MAQALHEQLPIVATIDPQSVSVGTAETDVIDLQHFQRVLFIVKVGALGTNSTVDFGVYGDTASNGSFATLITGKSIAQLTDAGGDDNKQVLVEVNTIDAAVQGFRYIRGRVTVSTDASFVDVTALADGIRFGRASELDLASVDEIVGP